MDWESWLEKNNAIETSHKDEKEKEEWDGKFSSSTIEDEVKDDKAISEEEPLDELTDGKLEEVEKLKSEVDKIITDLARKIKNPEQREDIAQRQADQKVKETVTKAWELFLVNKMPMNQYDKQPQKKPNEKGLKPEPLTETVPIKNPRGSLGLKKVKRLNHEAGDGSRKIVEIPKELSTNPETDIGGGRPEEPNVVGDLKHGSPNSTAGGTGKITQENTNSILYNALAEEEKEKESDNKTDDEVTISNDETDPATPIVPETPAEKRARIIRQFDRKKRDKKNKIIKSWETWLEKDGRWDSDEAKEKEKKAREARATIDALKEWASQPEKSEKQQAKEHYNQGRAYDEESHSAQQLPKKTRIPRTRVAGHTSRPIAYGDRLYGNFSPKDTKEGENSPTHDKYRKTTGRSDHAMHSKYKIPKKLSGKFDKDFEAHTGKKPTKGKWNSHHEIEDAMASISTTEAELGKSWESWLEKKDKYSGMTAKQRKIQESIDNEQREDPMVYDSKNAAWESWLEKNSINPSKGQLREGNKPKDYEYRQGADMDTMFGANTNEFEFPQEPKNEFQRQSSNERNAYRERNILEEIEDKKVGNKSPTPSPKKPKNDKFTRDDIKVGHSTIPRDDNESAETTKPANRIGMPDIRRRHHITNNLAEKLSSWEGWLEKMQGAGDARFGNQHLTGLDQKPVNNEEDEANIMPEKDEKTDDKEEKPNEKEEKYEEDNKPYKALDVK